MLLPFNTIPYILDLKNFLQHVFNERLKPVHDQPSGNMGVGGDILNGYSMSSGFWLIGKPCLCNLMGTQR